MQTFPPPPPGAYPLPSQPEAPRGGLGCFAKGCIVLLCIGLLFGALAGGLGYWAWSQARSLTDDHPIPVPILETATDAQAAEVAARIKAFTDTVNAGKRATLSLSDYDLNAIVARDPKYREARGRVFFAIKKDALHTRLSVPLDGVPTFKGRWLNGEAGLDIRFEDGELTLKPVSLEVKGKAVSEATLKALSSPEATAEFNEKLRQKMQQDPKLAETMKNVESIAIKDNKLVIVANGGGGENGAGEI